MYVLHVLIWGFGGCWKLLTLVRHLDLDLDMVNGLWFTNIQNLGSLFWFGRCKEHLSPLSHDSELCRMLEVLVLGLASWSWFGYGHWSLIHHWSNFWLSILILKVQRTSMSFKSSFGALEDAGVSWLGFDILILIWIRSLIFDISMIWILILYLDFQGAKNINVLLRPHFELWRTLEVPDWGLASWSQFGYGH